MHLQVISYLATNFFVNFRLCVFQRDRSQFAPKIVILNPSSYWTINSNLYFLKLGSLSLSSTINACFSSAVSCLQFPGFGASFFCNFCFPSFICRVALTIYGQICFWEKTLYDFNIYFPMMSKYVTWSPSEDINNRNNKSACWTDKLNLKV